ncbi:MAG: hypothetical protein JW827_11140 [Spirochaetes bacterium]|nr:hypothetical protein [Spirochaetota bacterium]
MFGAYLGLPLILITLAVGYFVLVKANKEANGLKTIGQVFGWIIIVISIVALVLSLYYSSGYLTCGRQGMSMWQQQHMKGMGQGMMKGQGGMMEKSGMRTKSK